jgi:ABC-type transporter Mla subunit MlaD
MPLFSINIEKVIIQQDPEILKEIVNLLKQIKHTTTMSQEILDSLNAKADAAAASLTNIKTDITKIKESLPTEGGLTADEVAQLSAKLDAVVSQADSLDKENE